MSDFVSIVQPEVDLPERAVSRLLLQFRKSPLMIDLLQALISEIIALQTAFVDMINKRGPADATGENLNVIGRIVGQGREIFDYADLPWFTSDLQGYSVDEAPSWVAGAYLDGVYYADDTWFRRLIFARVARNFVRYGAVTEILDVIKKSTGYDVSFQKVGPMEVNLVVGPEVPQWAITFILRMGDNSFVDNTAFIPYPATLRIAAVILYSHKADKSDSVTIKDTATIAVA
jgi:hypothetical protein